MSSGFVDSEEEELKDVGKEGLLTKTETNVEQKTENEDDDEIPPNKYIPYTAIVIFVGVIWIMQLGFAIASIPNMFGGYLDIFTAARQSMDLLWWELIAIGGQIIVFCIGMIFYFKSTWWLFHVLWAIGMLVLSVLHHITASDFALHNFVYFLIINCVFGAIFAIYIMFRRHIKGISYTFATMLTLVLIGLVVVNGLWWFLNPTTDYFFKRAMGMVISLCLVIILTLRLFNQNRVLSLYDAFMYSAIFGYATLNIPFFVIPILFVENPEYCFQLKANLQVE